MPSSILHSIVLDIELSARDREALKAMLGLKGEILKEAKIQFTARVELRVDKKKPSTK